jgi:chromatin remodeling complex protein RSC6
MSKKKTNIQDVEYKKNDDLKGQFVELLSSISTIKLNITLLSQQVKQLERSVNKKIKVLEKDVKKNKNKGNRKPTGFASPSKISKQLCNFMDVKEGTLMARTDVTKYIINYIKTNKLQGVDNKKIIQPDKALKSLLKPNKEDEVNYFTLQKYMNKHFLK